MTNKFYNIFFFHLVNLKLILFQEVISLLEEELFKVELTEETYVSKNTEISECVSCLKIDSISFLLKRPISFLLYDPCNNARILTVHGVIFCISSILMNVKWELQG